MPWDAFKLSVIQPAMAHRLLSDYGISDSEPLYAHVNRGRWVIRCECGGGEYAFEAGVTMCQSCWNGKHGHKYRRVNWPPERGMIEQLLLVRPLDNRNWVTGECINGLERENSEHRAELIGG